MKGIFLTFLVCIFFLNGQTQYLTPAEKNEPKNNFELTINGKKYNISEDEDLKLDSLVYNPTISVKLAQYKKFKNLSISFDYPRNLSFEFEQDFGYKNWTLSGNSLMVLVFEIDAKTTLASLVDEMVKKFGKKNCVVEDYQKELGHKRCDVKKLHVSLVGQHIILECFEIKLNDFKSRFIYFQDTIEDNLNSKEYEQGYKIIDSSIIFK